MIESIPNFSEGRDLGIVKEIRDAIASVPGVLLLGCESDSDHNRSVITVAGPAEAIGEGIVRGAIVAAQRIDLSKQTGVHPRIGAADVIPFVPLAGSTMDECVTIARRAARELWQRAQLPSYFYEFAAEPPKQLEQVRKGGFEALIQSAACSSPATSTSPRAISTSPNASHVRSARPQADSHTSKHSASISLPADSYKSR